MNERDKELVNQAWLQKPGWHDGYVNIQMLINLVRADEREACALICDEHADDPVYCGTAIRARGQA